jgi:hypothetical protein
MSRIPALNGVIAATAALALLVPPTSSAFATDAPVAAVPAKPAPVLAGSPVARHHVAFHHRYGGPVQAGLGCTGQWCGRQFVLMVGIGY